MDPRPLIAASGPVGGQDPFYAFKGELDDRLNQASGKFQKWKQLLETTNTATSREFKSINRSLCRDVDGIIRELNELERIAIKTVEKQRNKFAYIDDAELGNRKKYVSATRYKVRQMKETMSGPQTSGKIEQDKRLILLGRDKKPRGEAQVNPYQSGNKDFLQRQSEDTKRVFQEQDQVLDVLEGGVGNLNNMAIDIGKELDEQNRLLNEFGEDVDEFNTRFGALGIGMQKLLKTNNNCYLAMICFLSITFGIMLFVYVQGWFD